MNLYKLGKNISSAYLNTFYKIETIGQENIPQTDGVLICSNHISNLDPPIVGVTSPRTIYFMAKEELFRLPILKFILPRVNAFPVKRGMSDKQALKNGLKVLKDNKVLGLFPEGTRSKTGKLGKPLAGAGFFALRTNAKVVPCAIIGPVRLFGKLKVIYGEPIDFEHIREAKLGAQEAADIIMESIQALIDKHQQ